MYDSKTQTIGQTATNSILENSVNELSNLLNTQSSFLSDIEHKLHSIVNKQSNKEVSPNVPESEPKDFAEKISRQLKRMQEYNGRLDRIYQHLSEII